MTSAGAAPFSSCSPHLAARLLRLGDWIRRVSLLIITNDGELSLKLTHPRFKIDKEYEVTLDKPFDPELRKSCCAACTSKAAGQKRSRSRFVAKAVELVLRQGLKRQIRLMFYALEYEVLQLARVRIGSIASTSIPANGGC
jgi:23S rRNA pseudouridine2605 synthase